MRVALVVAGLIVCGLSVGVLALVRRLRAADELERRLRADLRARDVELREVRAASRGARDAYHAMAEQTLEQLVQMVADRERELAETRAANQVLWRVRQLDVAELTRQQLNGRRPAEIGARK